MTGTMLDPVAESERVVLFDVLRGFALLGILVVNFMGEEGSLMPSVDALVSSALAAFVSWSFYPLFSFLFGLGFAVQLARAKSRGTGASLLYFRRMLVLFLIGTIHAVFIWGGDILVRYSLAGLLLIPLHRLPQKALLALSLVLFAVILNGDTVRAQVESWRGVQRGEAAELITGARVEEDRIADNQYRLLAVTGASYGETSIGRWHAWTRQVRAYADWLNWVLNDVLLCFIAGLMVGRARVLHEAAERRRALFLAASIALLTAAVGLYANTSLELPAGLLANLSWSAENYGMTVFYISTIALLHALSRIGRRVLSVFAAPGRMGLTNYLMQSVVMTSMSMSYGFGWRPSATVWLALNLGFFFGLQVPISRWWLRRFHYGPAEWLWRSLTYGRRQPLRVMPEKMVLERMPRASV